MVDPDAVSITDLDEWSTEFDQILARISSLFVHPASRRHAQQYLRGLLAPITRKTGGRSPNTPARKNPKRCSAF
jgi:hypothetical protein